jgi:hypothetical protein
LPVCFLRHSPAFFTRERIATNNHPWYDGAVVNQEAQVFIAYSLPKADINTLIVLSGYEKTVKDYLSTIFKNKAVVFKERNGKIFVVPITPTKHAVTISGFITSTASAERLAGASIIVNEKNSTTANSYGFYSITLRAGDSFQVMASYVGYITEMRSLQTDSSLLLNIALTPAVPLQEIVVTGSPTKKETPIQQSTQMSSAQLSAVTIKSLPALLGETDVAKIIQLLPGVQNGNEGTSGLYIRGGTPDQNLILLDGVPVYNISHLFGVFSIFNADAISTIQVIKGGVPARYGGRLSSIIDIGVKEGNRNKMAGEVAMGFIAPRFTLEGPLGKNKKTSFIVSARRTLADLFLGPISKIASANKNTSTYTFYDVTAKINRELSAKDHLYLSGYWGTDRFRIVNNSSKDNLVSRQENQLSWGSTTAILRWNHVFNKKVFGNLSAYYGKFSIATNSKKSSSVVGNLTGDSLERYSQSFLSGIRDWAARYDIDYRPIPHHFIRAGVGAMWHVYKPGALQTTVIGNTLKNSSNVFINSIYSNEWNAYIEDDIKISNRLKANLGLHVAGFKVADNFFSGLQPRLSARYLLTPMVSLKASYTKMNQFLHLLTNNGIGLPTDLWVPVTKKIPMQTSHQMAAGLAWNFKQQYEITIEAYYKKMNNIIEYAEGASFYYSGFNNQWEDKVELGKGKNYGMEFFLEKKKGLTRGMISYTLAFNNRQFDKLNDGKVFPFKYDRRHDFKIAVVHTVDKKLELSADWVFNTGQALSLPVEVIQNQNGGDVEIYKQRNQFRMPNTHRLNVSVKFIKQRTRYERAWVLGVYNAYNRKNPFYIYRNFSLTDNGIKTYQFKQVSVLLLMPSVSYQIKF